MPQIKRANATDIYFWTDINSVEYSAMQQIYDLSKLDIFPLHLSIMPDVHIGKSATVGSVLASASAVIPSAVGVDIGCGMLAVKTNIDADKLPNNLKKLRLEIESRVPVGLEIHKYDKLGSKLNPEKLTVWDKLEERKDSTKLYRQVGTLGGGNHFIEICLDETDTVWIMLHSGSRGVGKQVASIHIENAKRNMKKMLDVKLPNQELAYLTKETPEFGAYMNDLNWCQEYAAINRKKMLDLVFEVLQKNIPSIEMVDRIVSCHHNYIAEEEHFGQKLFVTRKGAISAKAGQLGIIPGSMGTRSYIVRGKGEPFSFTSASHGAGRKYSRSMAKTKFDLSDVAIQTKGIECRKDKGIIDELPKNYKDIDQVMANQEDLVEIVHTLRQIICIKG